MPRSDLEAKWVKFGNIKELVFLSDDAIAVASGIHVIFFNLTTGEEKIEIFDDAERGIGASCLAGHPVVPMFATAERRSRPKITIFTYPGIRRVSRCLLENGPNGYLSSVFAGTEYLVAMTAFPDFKIVVWLWRNGEFMTEIGTAIADDAQRIACSSSSPYLISQLGEKTGKLAVYEMNVCSRIVTIARVNDSSSTRNIVSSSWTTDCNLFNCDEAGNVSLMSSDGKKSLPVVREEKDTPISKKSPSIETLGTGVVLVNRRSQIVLYRKSKTDNRAKSGSPWRSVWSIQAISHPIAVARFPRKDSLLFCGEAGEIFEVSDEDDTPRVRVIAYQGSRYEFLTAINPRCDHVVAIDERDRLSIFQCLTGRSVGEARLEIHGRVRSVASHPTLPIIATCTETGKCVIVNVTKTTEPSVVRVIHLQRETLDIIRYSFAACQLAVADTRDAKLFVIGSIGIDRYSVLGLLTVPMKIIDFLVYENGDASSKILVLVKTNESLNCGNRIVVYSFDRSTENGLGECIFEMTNMLDSLNYGRSRYEIIVVPYLTKQLHLIRIQEDYRGVTLYEAFSTGHQLRNINVSLDSSFLVTCSYDGLIIVRSRKNVRQVLSILMCHLRLDGGSKFAVPSSIGTVVSLGRNGDIIATSARNLEVALDAATVDEQTLSSEEAEVDVKEDNLTWLERRASVNLQNEREECAAERGSIQRDFFKLRERLKILLDANDRESVNARLLISDFELDRASRDKKINDNVRNRQELTARLEDEMFQQDRVAQYIRRMCWDSMRIAACSLKSVNGKIKVDNFPIAYETKKQQDRREWEHFFVDFEPFLNSATKPDNLLADRLSIIGTTTHRWIPERSASSGHQIRKYSGYIEGIGKSAAIRDQEQKLKLYFDELFEDMRAVKERELDLAARRIEEIKYCRSELKSTFDIDEPNDDNAMPQPLWHCSEKPETIVTVTDDEISSGSAATFLERDNRMEIIEKRKEESSKLKDSFRDEALNVMMDGLLEVRWENEIKKDPPKPACLSNGEPSKYTAEEIAAVEMYRAKCRQLAEERAKYKKILNDKIVTVKEALRQGVEAFDRKLNIFYLDRMKIESAVYQETSMRLRESQHHLLRRRGMERMQTARNDLGSATKEYRSLNDTSNALESAVGDTRNRYENLVKRDKMLETKLRGEFPDLKQPMVEHLLRHYRKRPRNVQLTCTSITYLTELIGCIVSGEKSEILPRDCLDFLRGMDSLDLMPNNLPAQIDSNHWSLLCKLRRAKVELEVKITSCAVDLAEAEQTFASFQKTCSSAENRVSQLRDAIKELDAQQSEALEDMEVQMVMKMGQIEARLFGDPNDLRNAVLVPFSFVERGNDAIIAAGREKLVAMRKTVEYRRTILWHEWRHNCMRITLEDMKEELRVLQGIKVTKDIQLYLANQGRDDETDTEAKMCERILASTKERYRGIVEEKKIRLIDASGKVVFWSKQNKRLAVATERMKATCFKASMSANDETRQRDALYHRIILKTIAKRTTLTKRVQDNYGELMALHTRLELLRLKTYPTLRLKGHVAKGKAITDRAN